MISLSEFLRQNPNYFESIHYHNFEAKPPLKKTVIVAQPRSGSTLLARLLEMGCMTRTIGDKSVETFESILQIWKEMKNNKGQYGSYRELENAGIFGDERRGWDSREKELRNFRFVLSNLIFANTFRSGCMKTTNLGFVNGLIPEFVEMLREVYEEDSLTIVWLTRDHDQIIKSFLENPNTKSHIEGCEDITKDALVHQLSQMKECYDLGDTWLTYDDLLADPVKQLKRCNPIVEPCIDSVTEVMAKKIRF